MSKPLTFEEVAALKAVPLGTMPNKVGIALKMAGCRQADICSDRALSPVQVSNAVNGKGVTSVELAREIAAFFACPIEVLWPGPAEEPEPLLPFDGTTNRRAGDRRREAVAP